MKQVKFDRLDKLKEELKEDKTGIVVTSITLAVFIGMLVCSVIFSIFALTVTFGVGVGMLMNVLIVCICSYSKTKAEFKKELMLVELAMLEETQKFLLETLAEMEKEFSERKAKTVPLQEEKAETVKEAEQPKEVKKKTAPKKSQKKDTKK